MKINKNQATGHFFLTHKYIVLLIKIVNIYEYFNLLCEPIARIYFNKIIKFILFQINTNICLYLYYDYKP